MSLTIQPSMQPNLNFNKVNLNQTASYNKANQPNIAFTGEFTDKLKSNIVPALFGLVAFGTAALAGLHFGLGNLLDHHLLPNPSNYNAIPECLQNIGLKFKPATSNYVASGLNALGSFGFFRFLINRVKR